MTRLTTPHPDLLAAQALAYAPCGYSFAQLQPEAESADYAACTLLLNGMRVQYRLGRGPIQPFELSDPVDVFVVSCRSWRTLWI